MKLTVQQDTLHKALSLAGRAVHSRSTLPVLGNIALSAEGGQLRVAATNLEVGINTWIDADIDEVGGITYREHRKQTFRNSAFLAQTWRNGVDSMTQPYLFFSIERYYPSGGMGDCKFMVWADNDEEAIGKIVDFVMRTPHLYGSFDVTRIDADSWVDVSDKFFAELNRRKME